MNKGTPLWKALLFEHRLPWRYKRYIKEISLFKSINQSFDKRNKLKLLSNLISKGDLIFDIGANIGLETEKYLILGASKVICVEPQLSCLKELKEKFSDNNKITIIEKGISNEEGSLRFYISKNGSGCSTFSEEYRKNFRKIKYDEELEVPVTTLNNLIRKYGIPKFCKVDVEGFELQVFKGLSIKIPYICYEFHSEMLYDAKKCADYLSSLGKAMFNLSIYRHAINGRYHKENRFYFKDWVDKRVLFSKLDSLNVDRFVGDIYVKIE